MGRGREEEKISQPDPGTREKSLGQGPLASWSTPFSSSGALLMKMATCSEALEARTLPVVRVGS